MLIDADAHVEESVETWKYLEPEYYPFRPIPVLFPEDTCFGGQNVAWVIDYKLRLYVVPPTSSIVLRDLRRGRTSRFAHYRSRRESRKSDPGND